MEGISMHILSFNYSSVQYSINIISNPDHLIIANLI